MTSPELATRLDLTIAPDPCRVIIKLFVPGEDAALVHTRASAIIERIAHLDEDESSLLLSQTLKRFGTRHRDLEATFRHHYDLVRHRVAASSDLSPTARTLVGAYFSHEYAVEAAALCNPSMVAHPDQSALGPAQLRVVISLRQIGEGHISSITFRCPNRTVAISLRSIIQILAMSFRSFIRRASLSGSSENFPPTVDFLMNSPINSATRSISASVTW